MPSRAAWVKNPVAITGLDPLGVRSPCEYVYSQLLPGITNVTDRARYYSFYPWLIWAIEQHKGNLRQKPTYEIIRLADCLYTLIGLYHHSMLGKPDDLLHGGLTGSRKLSSVINDFQQSGNAIRLSKYASIEDSSDRYFMNKLGGFGQYYLGPLSDTGLVERGNPDEMMYTQDRGLPMAEAFDSGISRVAFFAVLEKDLVGSSDFEQLVGFCPCQLPEKSNEQSELVSFFFNQTETYHSEVFEHRPQSLTALLELIKALQSSDRPMQMGAKGVRCFLECIYRSSLPDSTLWILKNPSLVESVQGWKQYYANEMLSLALQTLFWAGLSKMSESEIYIPNTNAFGAWFAKVFIPVNDLDAKVGDLIDEKFASLPELGEAEDLRHEANLAIELLDIAANKNNGKRYENAVLKSIELLLSLAARSTAEDWESAFTFTLPVGYQESYPVNIFSFLRNVENSWRDLDAREWLGWLTARWCIESHIRIALGKLRYESRDTFKIIPSENGLRIIEPSGAESLSEILFPGFTNPRLRQSLQILMDLGAISMDKNGALSVSRVGEEILGGAS